MNHIDSLCERWSKQDPVVEIEACNIPETLPVSLEIMVNEYAHDDDDINKPGHYTIPRAASDCFSVQQQTGLLNDHPVAAAFKYIWRCKQKGSYLKDLKKAHWFLTKAIEIEESRHEAEHSTEKGDKDTRPGINNK